MMIYIFIIDKKKSGIERVKTFYYILISIGDNGGLNGVPPLPWEDVVEIVKGCTGGILFLSFLFSEGWGTKYPTTPDIIGKYIEVVVGDGSNITFIPQNIITHIQTITLII